MNKQMQSQQKDVQTNVLELVLVYALILEIVPLKWIRPNTDDAMYVTDSSIMVTQKLSTFWNSSDQKVTKRP